MSTYSYEDVTSKLDEKKSNRIYVISAMIATLGGLIWGYDAGIIGSTLVFVTPYFHLNALDVAILVSGQSIFSVIGALVAGPIADKYGRKPLLVADGAMYAVFAILSAAATTGLLLIIWRSLIGFSIGADSAIATGYVAEFAPRRSRGRLAIVQQLMIFVGFTSSFWAGYLISPSADWRLMYFLGAIPAILMVVLRFGLPESPRWLLVHGRTEEAKNVLRKLGVIVDGSIATPQRDAPFSQLFKNKAVLRALVSVGIFFAFFNTVGGNIILYYGPSIYVYLGLSGTKAIYNTAMSETLGAIAYALSFYLIDKWGRRRLVVLGYGGIAASLFIMIVGLHEFLSGILGFSVILVFLAATIFLFFAHLGIFGVGWVIQGEVFPSEFRARAGSILSADSWITNWLILFIFPIWKSLYGTYSFFVLEFFIALAAVISVYYLMPETKGRSVEKMQELFTRPYSDYRKVFRYDLEPASKGADK